MVDKPGDKPENPAAAARPPATTPGAASGAASSAGSGTAAGGAAPETSTPAAPAPPPKEEKTQPFRLKELAGKLAQRRRRSTAAELTFKRGKSGAEVRVPLERTETVIGRDPVCDIVLAEKSASARHARIKRNGGGFFELEDLGSSNGVFVDGDRIEKMTLLDGDAFQIGDTRFSILIAPVVGEDG